MHIQVCWVVLLIWASHELPLLTNLGQLEGELETDLVTCLAGVGCHLGQ
jgi:hypothetical protein